MKNYKTNLQFFASIDDVITGNKDSFGEGDTTKTSFDTVAEKLKGLGYDVLINQREKAEFIPISRLNEVVSQRETFKKQAEDAIVELGKLKKSAGLSDESQQKVEELIKQNETLLAQLQEANTHREIMSYANDAINPLDIIPFINMDAIKRGKNGEIVGGIKEEVERVKTEKPYLFNAQQGQSAKAGFDGENSNTKQQLKTADMNAAIRRAAYSGSRSF